MRRGESTLGFFHFAPSFAESRERSKERFLEEARRLALALPLLFAGLPAAAGFFDEDELGGGGAVASGRVAGGVGCCGAAL
jgi:hypothetical protein